MKEDISLNKYILRQKIVFNEFIESGGKENSLIPFQKSFAIEDNVREYTYVDIRNYLLSYVKGNNITKEELEAYKKAKSLNGKTVFMRGNELVVTYIKTLGDEKKLESLLKIYSQEDGKFKIYSKGYIKSFIDYYKNKVSLNNINGHIIIVKLYEFIEKKIENKEDIYSNDFFYMLYDAKDMKEAIQLLRLTSLNKSDYLNYLEKEAKNKSFSTAQKGYLTRLADLSFPNQIVEEKKEESPKREKKFESFRSLDKFKVALNMLIEKPLELDRILKFNEMHYKTFNDYMDFDFSKDDMELETLKDEYKIKLEEAENELMPKIDLIVKGLSEGVLYNGKFRVMNLYDYYRILDMNVPPNIVANYIAKVYRRGKSENFMKYFLRFEHGKEYFDSEEITKDFFNGNITDISYNQVYSCAEYILSNGWVLNMYTLKDTLARLCANDIEIPIIDHKMNKI